MNGGGALREPNLGNPLVDFIDSKVFSSLPVFIDK